MNDPAYLVRQVLGRPAESVEVLKENDRTTVLRVRAGDDAVVVKVYRGGEGRLREAAALVGTDLLVRTCSDPEAVVLRDLGESFALSDVLLTFDRASAAKGVEDWARAIGELHVRTAGGRGQFEDALDAQAAELAREPPPVSTMPRALAEAVETLRTQAPRAGVPFPDAAAHELLAIEGLLQGGEAAHALTPADACPDNNIVTDDGLVLLDFEGASWRHVAWDAAYLTVPWPSCWCSWRLPADVSAAALAVFRDSSVPHTRTPAFDKDLALTTAGWAVLSIGWFLERALDDRPWQSEDLPIPHHRALVQHRLMLVEDPRLPQVTAFARDLLAAARRLWGDVPLELAPAFRPHH